MRERDRERIRGIAGEKRGRKQKAGWKREKVRGGERIKKERESERGRE